MKKKSIWWTVIFVKSLLVSSVLIWKHSNDSFNGSQNSIFLLLSSFSSGVFISDLKKLLLFLNLSLKIGVSNTSAWILFGWERGLNENRIWHLNMTKTLKKDNGWFVTQIRGVKQIVWPHSKNIWSHPLDVFSVQIW